MAPETKATVSTRASHHEQGLVVATDRGRRAGNPLQELMISNSATLLLILVAVYCLGIFDHGLWAPMDTVGAGMIWGMHDAGSWVVPLLNGEPYLEKPPLMHWTALVLMSLTGQINEALVRMPSAIYGLGAVLIVY